MPDIKKIIKIENALQEGDAVGLARLKRALSENSDEKCFATLFKRYHFLAALGDAEAQLIVSVMYKRGIGVIAYKYYAEKWLSIALEQSSLRWLRPPSILDRAKENWNRFKKWREN